jgi:hypothetical protein
LFTGLDPTKHPQTTQPKLFLQSILKTLAGLEDKHAQRVKNDMFVTAVNFSSKRILYYIKYLQPEVDFVLKDLLTLGIREGNFTQWEP